MLNNVANPDDFEDVLLITLKQHLTEMSYDIAWQNGVHPSKIDEHVERLRAEYPQHTSAREFVEITENKIVVGLNADTIDNNAIDKAIVLLTQVDNFSPGRTFYFGDHIDVNFD